MLIGLPKEIKNHEYRVALTPSGVKNLTNQGHKVLIETQAGIGSGFNDELYQQAGGQIITTAEEAWSAEIVVKVKDPLEAEYAYFRDNLILFTYLHLAANESLTKALLGAKVTAIAYETIELQDNSLPLLTPMSQIAGRMATQIGARLLEKSQQGAGILLGGIPGVTPAKVVILGAGVVGSHAAQIALGMGAYVTVLDINPKKLEQLENNFQGRLFTLIATEENIHQSLQHCDLLIGAVLVTGAKAPTLVNKAMLSLLNPKAVIIDVAIDQGGCIETIQPTTHDKPTFEVDGIIHYGVTNMPGAVPKTSTIALTSLSLPYILQLAEQPITDIPYNSALAKGVNVYQEHITLKAVAQMFQLPFKTFNH